MASVLQRDTSRQQSSDPVTFEHALFGRPTGKSYRAAVAQVIRNVKALKRLSNEAMAEAIGCSEGTVCNAENEEGNLAAVTLLSIAFVYGEEAIAPVRELYLCSPTPAKTRADKFREAHAMLDELERGE